MAQSRYRWVIVAAGGLLGCVAIGGMFSLPVWERGSCMDIASMDHSIPPEGCVLMLPRSCSTRTVEVSLCPGTTRVKRPPEKVITPQQR